VLVSWPDLPITAAACVQHGMHASSFMACSLVAIAQLRTNSASREMLLLSAVLAALQVWALFVSCEHASCNVPHTAHRVRAVTARWATCAAAAWPMQ
jgi:hypothetical protein